MSAPVQKENSNTNPELDQLCINTIRALSLDAVRESLSQRAGRDFDSRGQDIFRVARGFRSPLAKMLNLVQRQIVAGQV